MHETCVHRWAKVCFAQVNKRWHKNTTLNSSYDVDHPAEGNHNGDDDDNIDRPMSRPAFPN